MASVIYSVILFLLNGNAVFLVFGEQNQSSIYFDGSKSDFFKDNVLSSIAFGSCMNGMFNGSKWYESRQFIWQQIMEHNPDLWLWLGDAVYADTRILPFLWVPSSQSLMAKYFQRQKQHPDYQKFIEKIPLIGVWDDHDYGFNDGGKHFKNKLQSQDIYLDFINEPFESLRRKREGLYVSYTFGHGNKAIKLILLDVRSHAVYGSNCDLLGVQQWKWLTQQLDDSSPVAFTIITSGIQILSNAPLLQNWQDCPNSHDRLLWLTKQRGKVIFLSGDVHFGEISCLNSPSSGFPFYEITSSGLYYTCNVGFLPLTLCRWLIRNVFIHELRVSEPVVERNFGFLEINWETSPIEINAKIYGENNSVQEEQVINLDHITKKWNADKCVSKKHPQFIIFYTFWSCVGFIAVVMVFIFLIFTFKLCRITWRLLSIIMNYNYSDLISHFSRRKLKRQ